MKLFRVEDIIWAAKLATENTSEDAEVAKLLAGVGFNEKRLRELGNLTTVVEALELAKKQRYQESMLISERIDKEANMLRPVFKEHVAAVRFAFRHEPALLRSFLPKPIPTNKWNWIEKAHHFYSLLMPYVSQLEPHGVSAAEVEQARTSVEALMSRRNERMRKKGEAEDKTEGRNQAIRQLKSLLREFHASARLALKDNPQKLEAFGIRVRSMQY